MSFGFRIGNLKEDKNLKQNMLQSENENKMQFAFIKLLC